VEPSAAVAAPANPALVEIAVPLPLPPLTYTVPRSLQNSIRIGQRVRVRVGNRRVAGIVTALPEAAPEGVALRPLEAIIDREPALSAELLELARFAASYYLAPIGEVLRTMLPASLPAGGERRVWLTDGGALSTPRNAAEAAIVAALSGGEKLRLEDLENTLGEQLLPADLDAALATLAAAGRITGDELRPRAARYVTAYERARGELEAQLEAAGKSAPAHAVLHYLAEIDRPATAEELLAAAECGAGVLRRLVTKRLLRTFTQVEHLDLGRHVLTSREEPAPIELRPDQSAALSSLVAGLESHQFSPFLLQGMTGAGKTEVYLRAAETALSQGRSAILMVPEIALVPALAREARARFGDRLALLHSGLGTGERAQEWERIRRGDAPIVLGPRSSLFAPVTRLGLIVVDEEQDGAYKQDIVPRYHARDLALVRGRNSGAVTVLVSATPSLESRYNAEQGKLQLLTLTQRAGQGTLPTGILVDMRTELGLRRLPGEVHFSTRLREEIDFSLAQGEQLILLRNRRGYSPMLLCRACGESMRCEACGLPRTFHRRAGYLRCHYCGSTLAVPERCPTCSEDALDPIGAGTERVEERFAELYPNVPVAVLDRDAASRPGELASILERFGGGEAQVLIGTQMVSKGHHFPRVGLTAMLAADSHLRFPDFRAVEKTYTLLTQLAGRAGRGDRPGRFVIQTYHPEHYAIRAALNGDDAGFAQEEMRFRRAFHYPPYTRLVQILVHDRNRTRGEESLRNLAREVEAHPKSRSVRLSGPAPAPFERLRGEWRFQLLLRSSEGRDLHQILRDVLSRHPAKAFIVDVDPQQLL
jgi:primosomal protein N' (replication factor Y)